MAPCFLHLSQAPRSPAGGIGDQAEEVWLGQDCGGPQIPENLGALEEAQRMKMPTAGGAGGV